WSSTSGTGARSIASSGARAARARSSARPGSGGFRARADGGGLHGVDVRIWIDDGDGFGSRGKLGHAHVAGCLGRLGELRLVRVVRRPPAAAIHAGEAEYRDRDEHGGEDDG